MVSGYALLVPVAPLWVIHGGSDSLGAGLITGVMMACTVVAQLSMHRLLAERAGFWLVFALAVLPALGIPFAGPTACMTSRTAPWSFPACSWPESRTAACRT